MPVKTTASFEQHGSFMRTFSRIASGEGTLTVAIKRSMRHRREDGTYISTMKLALIHEFGAPNNKLFGHPAPIPARPALSANWKHNGRSYLASARTRAVMARKGQADLDVSMNTLGKRIVRDIELSYETWGGPPNRPYTLKKKRRNDPLVVRHRLAKAWTHTWTSAKSATTVEVQKSAKKIDADLTSLASRLMKK